MRRKLVELTKQEVANIDKKIPHSSLKKYLIEYLQGHFDDRYYLKKVLQLFPNEDNFSIIKHLKMVKTCRRKKITNKTFLIHSGRRV